MRKFTKLLVAAAFLLTSITSPLAGSAQASSFADLKRADAWAQAAIVKAKELGYISGDTEGNFNPLAKVTRQEAASILARMMKLDTTGFKTSTFSDVPAGLWGLGQIEAVKQAGLMAGDGGKFRPHDVLTREELAVILVKAAGIDATGKGSLLQFADKATISPWALDAVGAAFENGLMAGADNKFSPKASTTRQEMAVIAVNFSQAMFATVQKITEDTVTISGTTYQLGDAVKGIFAVKNQDILTGAKIKFRADGTTLTEVKELEITASGQAASAGAAEFSSNLVLEGAGAALKGSLKVSGNYITLQNLIIEGDLVISEQLQNDFYSDSLTVKGKTVVDGGDTNTVVFNNANLGAVNVNKPNVRVEAKGKTTLSEMNVTTDATIQADTGVKIPKLTVGTGAKKVEIDAPVGILDVLNSLAKLNIKKPIDKVVLPDGVKVGDLLENFERIKDLLKEIFIGTTPVDTRPTTPTTPTKPTTPLPGSIAPEADHIGVMNFAAGLDVLIGFAPLDSTVKVYAAPTGGAPIGSIIADDGGILAVATSDEDEGPEFARFFMELPQGIPAGAANVYVTFTETGKRESARVAVSIPAIPAAPSAADITVHNSVDEDYVLVENVPAGQIVALFDSADSRDAIALARNTEAVTASVKVYLNTFGDPGDVVIESSDQFGDMSQVFVALVTEGYSSDEVALDVPNRTAVSAFVAMDVPEEEEAPMSEAPELEDIVIMNKGDLEDTLDVYAPLGATVRIYDEEGNELSYAVSEGDIDPKGSFSSQDDFGGRSVLYVTVQEQGKRESAKTQVSVPVIPNAPEESDIEFVTGEGQIIISNVPEGATVYVYTSETGTTPDYTGTGSSGVVTITLTGGFPAGITTYYVRIYKDGGLSAKAAKMLN